MNNIFLTPYVYDEKSNSLLCTVCGGLGNAVNTPFVDSKLGYIPSHGHKEGCAYAEKELLETTTLPACFGTSADIEHQIAMKAASAEKQDEISLHLLLEQLDPKKYKHLRSFVLHHAGWDSVMFLERVAGSMGIPARSTTFLKTYC